MPKKIKIPDENLLKYLQIVGKSYSVALVLSFAIAVAD